MRERLDGLGLKAELTGINESMSEITIFCTKGWLEAPMRVAVKLIAIAAETIGGNEQTYYFEKEIMLLSQKKRKLPLSSAQMDNDNQQYEWVINAMHFITDNGLINDLGKEYITLGNMWDSFDENFGFDQLLVAQIQSRINDCIFRKKREALQKRQEYYEKLQETAHADNNFWTITSKSFAMASEKYVDTWGGIATRILLGVCTGGLSEVPFTAMDINKAVSDYNERTLLCDRTTGGKIFYGSVPVIMSAVSAGVMKGVGWSLKAMTPAPIRAGLKKWAMTQSQAVMKKIPEKWVYASKNIYNKFNGYAQKINSFDPRKKMLNIRTAAAKTDSLNLSAKARAQKDILNVRKGPLSAKGQFKSTLQRAGELKAAGKVDRYKKVAWLLTGIGMGLIINRFLAGVPSWSGVMAVIAAMMVSLQACGNSSGYLYSIARSLTSRVTVSGGAKTEDKNSIRMLLMGLIAGFACMIPYSAGNSLLSLITQGAGAGVLSAIPLVTGIILLIVGMIMVLAGKKRTNKQTAQ